MIKLNPLSVAALIALLSVGSLSAAEGSSNSSLSNEVGAVGLKCHRHSNHGCTRCRQGPTGPVGPTGPSSPGGGATGPIGHTLVPDFFCIRNYVAMDVPEDINFIPLLRLFASAGSYYKVSRGITGDDISGVITLDATKSYRVTISGIVQLTPLPLLPGDLDFRVNTGPGISAGSACTPLLSLKAGGGGESMFVLDTVIKGEATVQPRFMPKNNGTSVSEMMLMIRELGPAV